MSVSERTARSIIKSWNAHYLAHLDADDNWRWWQRRMDQAGLDDETAPRMVDRFMQVHRVRSGFAPSLASFLTWVRDNGYAGASPNPPSEPKEVASFEVRERALKNMREALEKWGRTHCVGDGHIPF